MRAGVRDSSPRRSLTQHKLVSLMSFVEVVQLDWRQLKASRCVFATVKQLLAKQLLLHSQH